MLTTDLVYALQQSLNGPQSSSNKTRKDNRLTPACSRLVPGGSLRAPCETLRAFCSCIGTKELRRLVLVSVIREDHDVILERNSVVKREAVLASPGMRRTAAACCTGKIIGLVRPTSLTYSLFLSGLYMTLFRDITGSGTWAQASSERDVAASSRGPSRRDRAVERQGQADRCQLNEALKVIQSFAAPSGRVSICKHAARHGRHSRAVSPCLTPIAPQAICQTCA